MRQQYLYSLTDEFLGQPSRYALTAQAHRAHCQQHNQSQTGMFTHVKENKINTTITTPVSQPLSQDNVGKPAYQKGKTSLDLNEARDDGVWGRSGISCTICKQSAPRSRQITTPTSHHSTFTDCMLFLMPNQQCQSTEGNKHNFAISINFSLVHYKPNPRILSESFPQLFELSHKQTNSSKHYPNQ